MRPSVQATLVGALVTLTSWQAPAWAAHPLSVGGHPVLGPRDALVTMVYFGDYECPFCRRFYPLLRRLVLQSRDVRLVVRHFPLRFHRHAHLAAEAAVEAARQGKFWAFHDALFKTRPPLRRQVLEAIARRVGLDLRRFRRALTSRVHRAAVQADIRDGRRAGVRGTPTVFVNGVRVAGANRAALLTTVFRVTSESWRLLATGKTTRRELYSYILSQLRWNARLGNVLEGLRTVRPSPALTLAGRPTLGRPDAPVRAVWFMNPVCYWSRRMLERLDERGPLLGMHVTVKLAVRPPLDRFVRAGLLALHAQDQGLFWSLVRALLRRRPYSWNAMVSLARQVGVARPEAALSSRRALRILRRDISEARSRSPDLGPKGSRCNGLLVLPDQLQTGWAAAKFLDLATLQTAGGTGLLVAPPD